MLNVGHAHRQAGLAPAVWPLTVGCLDQRLLWSVGRSWKAACMQEEAGLTGRAPLNMRVDGGGLHQVARRQAAGLPRVGGVGARVGQREIRFRVARGGRLDDDLSY